MEMTIEDSSRMMEKPDQELALNNNSTLCHACGVSWVTFVFLFANISFTTHFINLKSDERARAKKPLLPKPLASISKQDTRNWKK